MTRTGIALVGCGAAKLPHAAPARLLYTSTLFRLAAEYAQRHYARWFVLSAKHDLVLPDAILDPYEHRLSGAAADRQAFAWRIQAALYYHDVPADAVLDVFAGADYAALVAYSRAVRQPLAGLGVGERLAWLRARLDAL